MKLAGREAIRFSRKPDTGLCGALIHGADAGQVAGARQDLVAALMGPETDDLRLTRLDAAEARRDAALIGDALRARGFFPGRRIVVIEGGTDGLAKPLAAALEGVTADDAFLVVTADALPARSGLRKLFEGDRRLAGLGFFADQPGPADIEQALGDAGVGGGIEAEALDLLHATASGMDLGSFRQLIGVIALFVGGRAEPLKLAEVQALVPAGLEAEIDELVEAVASGAPARIGPLMRRLEASGTTPVSVLIMLQRHFRQLLTAMTNGGGEAGLGSLRPPVWGARRAAMARQMQRWGQDRLEQANRILFETDGKLRSSQQAPDMAVLERCALRLAIMGRR